MAKAFSIFINFNGECREAVEFYAKAFNAKVQDLMTYGQMPPDPTHTMAEEDKERVMYSCVPIFGCNVMFCDVPSAYPTMPGDNISPTLITDDKEEVKRIFAALSEGGQVGMELKATFWSEQYGMVTDKFGVTWQFSHDKMAQ